MHQDEFRPETIGWWIVMLIDILIDSMRGFFIASVYCFRYVFHSLTKTRWCILKKKTPDRRYEVHELIDLVQPFPGRETLKHFSDTTILSSG